MPVQLSAVGEDDARVIIAWSISLNSHVAIEGGFNLDSGTKVGRKALHIFDEIYGGSGVNTSMPSNNAEGEDTEVLGFLPEEHDDTGCCGYVLGDENRDMGLFFGCTERDRDCFHAMKLETAGDDLSNCS